VNGQCNYGCSIESDEVSSEEYCRDVFDWLGDRRLETTMEHPRAAELPHCEDKETQLFCNAHKFRGNCHLPHVHRKCARTCGACDYYAVKTLDAWDREESLTDALAVHAEEPEEVLFELPESGPEPHAAPERPEVDEKKLVATSADWTDRFRQPEHLVSLAGLLLVVFWMVGRSR
jgi:hypothetical protein